MSNIDQEVYRENSVGHPPHEPTLVNRAKVEGFVCAGFNQERIAEYFDIDIKTLRKHYKDELNKSKVDAIHMISKSAYQRAMDGDPKMIELILKCQGRWSAAKDESDKNDSKVSVLELLQVVKELKNVK